MSFFQVGLRRSLSVLRHDGPAINTLMRCSRPIARPFTTAKFTPVTESRVLKFLSMNQRLCLKSPPQPAARSFFTSSKQSLRYRPPPPPKQSSNFLGFLNNIPQKYVLYGIMGLNGLVFAAWLVAKQQYKVNGDAGPLIWMYQNFLSSWENLRAGRVWTVLTCCFSHQDWGHILLNGFTFFFMSPLVLRILGSRKFILLYLGAGLTSCGISLLYGRSLVHKDVPSHGASGAIYGVITFLACIAPTMSFHLYGVIPVPAWLVVTGLFSYDAYSTYADKRGTTDTVAHLGGMLSGALYFIFLRRSGRIIW